MRTNNFTDIMEEFSNYTLSIAKHIRKYCYGWVHVEYDLTIDTLHVLIKRKDFTFNYDIQNITQRFISDSSLEVANEVLSMYRHTIDNWFFKN